ncbi:MAG: AbrB/MazE/SpoVT family DNA-binding domain-containing protein [Methanocellales archaeon]|nr:AbrB/MazE/SpoVT family DNA-binding domain-containing protein [Methanocellales archaeon]
MAIVIKSKVGSRGQIVIPKIARENLGMVEGTGIIIEMVDDGIKIKSAKTDICMKRYSETVYLDANFFIFSLLDRTEVGEDARMIYQKMVEGELNTATSSLTFDEVM